MSDFPATVIQFSPATGYKQSQKTSTNHSMFHISWCVFFQLLLSHLPPNSIDPTFGHFIITVWPSFWYHFSATEQAPPCIQHPGDHPSLHQQKILTLFSGLCWPVTPWAQVAEPTTVCQHLYLLLKKRVFIEGQPHGRGKVIVYCIKELKSQFLGRWFGKLIDKISLHLQVIIPPFCNHERWRNHATSFSICMCCTWVVESLPLD